MSLFPPEIALSTNRNSTSTGHKIYQVPEKVPKKMKTTYITNKCGFIGIVISSIVNLLGCHL